jgi:hypothetical protein
VVHAFTSHSPFKLLSNHHITANFGFTKFTSLSCEPCQCSVPAIQTSCSWSSSYLSMTRPTICPKPPYRAGNYCEHDPSIEVPLKVPLSNDLTQRSKTSFTWQIDLLLVHLFLGSFRIEPPERTYRTTLLDESNMLLTIFVLNLIRPHSRQSPTLRSNCGEFRFVISCGVNI